MCDTATSTRPSCEPSIQRHQRCCGASGSTPWCQLAPPSLLSTMGPFCTTAAMRWPSCERVTASNSVPLPTSGLLFTWVQLAPRSVLMYMPPPYTSETMRAPPADTALPIQTPEGLLPEVQLAPPLVETCTRPFGASPATRMSPVVSEASECQISAAG
ncbi:hypothetical protein EZ216_16645 [Ramlibacter humi]|uniref:Uncharacterized protein n=1 Tax=Ramlibacter humi TaxID=2530451 RepID=A0A4Z0BIE4_9BURK|nr:hypothetical protein EZ216_16645 [Ramlibacter humi]